ncbi:MAG TPA: serine/threonine-protein kinase [Kofleriaceae bacterium]|nr:serine/threonine-protein kinase [Kofleriaceae bacterium]
MSGIPAGAGALLGKRLGKYEILALLALGGTAEIYLARVSGAAGFEKYVVVKVLHDHLADDPDFVKMFLDEARIGAMFDHANIVQTYELGEYENRYYMVMEFLAGLSLAMVVRRATERLPGGLMPVPLVLNIAAQACAGLHYTHERLLNGKPMNLVHRDISPQNLVINFEGGVKVVDFGIARAELRETKTKAGTIKGKFAYMSPEQCVAAVVDRRTDIFALGVIVHELLTGRRLFKRNSPYETYQAVLECAVEAPSKVNNQLDPALDDIVMKAVAKDKDKRYPTAEAFGDALAKYLHSRGKGSGGGEIGRWFDEHFSQEIEEHGERMRELISGRDFSVDTGVSWGEEEDKKANETRDLTGKGGAGEDLELSLQTGEIIEMRPSEASLDNFVGRLGTESDEPNVDEDGNPVERTRIEMNPLEKLDQMNAQVAHNTGQQRITPVPPGSMSGASPLPAPPAGPVKAVVRTKESGKFPDLPNMPTQIADDGKAPELAATAIGAKHVDPNHGVEAVGPMSSTQFAVRPSSFQKAQNATQPETAIPMGPGAPLSGPPMSGPPGTIPPPMGGPPMGGQMGGGPMGAGPMGAGPMGHGGSGPIAGHGPSAPLITDYPVMPGGKRPMSTDLAPSSLPNSQRSPYADAPLDPSAAANLMSPVGAQYPQTDWDRAAAMEAKALPPWKLGALFVAVVGGALLLTLLIAKIFA